MSSSDTSSYELSSHSVSSDKPFIYAKLDLWYYLFIVVLIFIILKFTMAQFDSNLTRGLYLGALGATIFKVFKLA